jgi:malonyl CoA-acyl carrier protein transacylase
MFCSSIVFFFYRCKDCDDFVANMTRIHVFPGEGSQKVGMGKELFERFPEQVAVADAELGYSVLTLCLRDPLNQLNQMQFAQPALFVVNALTFLNHLFETGKLPGLIAGHGLGEYNALFAAGVFDFQTGVRLVKHRANLLARAPGGGMAAVVGLIPDQIREALAAAGLNSIDIARLNSRSETVISGPEKDLETSRMVLERAGAQAFERLLVSIAFHSRYLSEAEHDFGVFLASFLFAEPRIPVISNVTARLYDSSQIKQLLARQITQPVRWTESIEWLLQQPEAEFTEMGPGSVLTELIRRIKLENQALPARR